jgi:hypothetical protein
VAKDEFLYEPEGIVIVCPQCGGRFNLLWGDGVGYDTILQISSRPSGGIYEVSIDCPYCDYQEEVHTEYADRSVPAPSPATAGPFTFIPRIARKREAISWLSE